MGALFDRIAQEYDGWYLTDLGKIVDQSERRLIEALFTPPGPTVLEVGCGTGQYSLWLTQKGYALTAVDISEKMMAKAKEKLKANGFEATWILGDIREVLPQLGRYHGIISVTAFEFIPESHELLKQLYERLEPGGVLVVGIIAGNSPWSQIYQEAALQNPDSVFRYARFWMEEEVSGWELGGKPPEISKALFFPPNAGTEAYALEQKQEGQAGFLVAKWVRE